LFILNPNIDKVVLGTVGQLLFIYLLAAEQARRTCIYLVFDEQQC